jgi:hypothetical protein
MHSVDAACRCQQQHRYNMRFDAWSTAAFVALVQRVCRASSLLVLLLPAAVAQFLFSFQYSPLQVSCSI